MVIFILDFGETGGFQSSRDNQIADLKQKLDKALRTIELLNESGSNARIEAQETISSLERNIAELRRELDDRTQASNRDVTVWEQRVQGLTAQVSQLLERCLPYDCIKNIQNREFRAAAEKLELLKQNEAVTADIVNQVYGGRIENVRLLNDFGKSIGDANLALLVYKPLVDTLSTNTVNIHIDDLIDLFKSVENKANGAQDGKAFTVKMKLRNLIKQAGTKALKDAMLNNQLTTELNKAMLTIDSNLFFEVIVGAMENIYGLIDARKMLDYIKKFESLPQTLDGYTALFNTMKNANRGWPSDELVELTFDIKELRKRNNYNSVDWNIRQRFETLKDGMPKSLSALAFSANGNVCLKNAEYDEYLTAAAPYQYDKDRREVKTSTTKSCAASWTIERDGGHVSIKNADKNECLFPSRSYHYNSIFTYIPNSHVRQNKWKIIYHQSGVRITNLVKDQSIAAYANSNVHGVAPGRSSGLNDIWEMEECNLLFC